MAKGKGKGLLVAAIVAIFVTLALMVTMLVRVEQGSVTGQQSEQVQQTTEVAAKTLKKGDASTQKFYVRDLASDNKGKVATSFSIEEWDGGGVGKGDMSLIADATASSATSTTSVSTEVGKWLKACAFNQSTYYSAGCLEYAVDGESNTETLDTYAINTMVKVESYDDGTKQAPGGGSPTEDLGNITLAASQKDSLDYLKITQNNSNSALHYRGLVVNVTDGSNIKDVRATGLAAWSDVNDAGLQDYGASLGNHVSDSVPERLSQVAEYAYLLPEPVFLFEFDSLTTGSISFEARSTNPDERVHFLLVDEGMYKSVTSSPIDQLKSGVENDQDSEGDVGGPDREFFVSVE